MGDPGALSEMGVRVSVGAFIGRGRRRGGHPAMVRAVGWLPRHGPCLPLYVVGKKAGSGLGHVHN
jgi:hypothetical protein